MLLSACVSNINTQKQPQQASKLAPQTVELSGKFAGNKISASTFYSWGMHPIWVPIFLEKNDNNWRFYKPDDGNLTNKNFEKIYYAYQENTFYLGVVPIGEINTFDGSPKDYIYKCEIDGGTRRVDKYDICASNFSISVGANYRRMDRDAIATVLNSLSDADIIQILDYIPMYIKNEKEINHIKQIEIDKHKAELEQKNKAAVAEKIAFETQKRLQFVKNTQIGDLVCNSSPGTMQLYGKTTEGTSIIGAHVEAVNAGKFKISIAFLKFRSRYVNETPNSLNLATGETIHVGSTTWMDSSSFEACN